MRSSNPSLNCIELYGGRIYLPFVMWCYNCNFCKKKGLFEDLFSIVRPFQRCGGSSWALRLWSRRETPSRTDPRSGLKQHDDRLYWKSNKHSNNTGTKLFFWRRIITRYKILRHFSSEMQTNFKDRKNYMSVVDFESVEKGQDIFSCRFLLFDHIHQHSTFIQRGLN